MNSRCSSWSPSARSSPCLRESDELLQALELQVHKRMKKLLRVAGGGQSHDEDWKQHLQAEAKFTDKDLVGAMAELENKCHHEDITIRIGELQTDRLAHCDSSV